MNCLMEDSGGWGVNVIANGNVGLFWSVFLSFSFGSSISSFFLSSSLRFVSQSKDIGCSLGHIFSSRVQIAHYFISGGMGEVRD